MALEHTLLSAVCNLVGISDAQHGKAEFGEGTVGFPNKGCPIQDGTRQMHQIHELAWYEWYCLCCFLRLKCKGWTHRKANVVPPNMRESLEESNISWEDMS